jgi:hypothetical protein
MERTINIGGAELRMRASALIPRMYRFRFGRDLIKDMAALEKKYKEAMNLQEGATEEEKQKAQLSALDLTIFENVAWVMAKAADKDIPDSPDEWLDGIEGVFSIYEILPQILQLWIDGLETTSTPAKK